MSSQVVAPVETGREAASRHAWREAYDAFTSGAHVPANCGTRVLRDDPGQDLEGTRHYDREPVALDAAEDRLVGRPTRVRARLDLAPLGASQAGSPPSASAMISSSMEPVRILLDTYAEPQELDAVRKVAKEGGLEAEVEGGYRKPKPGEAWGEGDAPEWIIVILVSSTFGAFFVRFFGEAGADAWKELKKLSMRLRDSRRRPTGPSIPPSPPHLGAIHFQDQYGNEIREGLRPTIPSDEFWRAWDSISEPDWSALGGWFVFWDYDRGAWAAFEPRLDSSQAVHWDREEGQWVEYEPNPMTAFEPQPSRIDRIKRFFSRRKV